ncbi:MAG: hypothetical protein EOL97_10260 [Spirochaetia bacterium]|nr:hypothetical protein [Spirochaetia bacterium]
MNFFKKILNEVKGFIIGFHQASLYKATAQIEYEVYEMENSFTLMLFGGAIGLPSPPLPVCLELLPLMEKDIERMLLRASQTGNGLSELASIMGEP